MNNNLIEAVVLAEDRNATDGPDLSAQLSKSVIIRNTSKDYITIIAINTNLGDSVEVSIRKDQIPEWILKEKK